MAELSPSERLQPSLLDRLTDDEPGNRLEARERRVLSMRLFRQAVLRDLAWLLNTTRMDALQDLSEYPLAAHSVINFGLPDLAGRAAAGLPLAEIERGIRQAVWDFEPRVLRNTVVVRAVADEGRNATHTVIFEIEGSLWAQPLPERLFLRTELDLEMGSVKLIDLEQGG